MALDTASTQFLQQLADQGTPPFHSMTPTDARAFFAGLREIIGEGPDMNRVGEHPIVSNDATITVRTLVPSDKPEGIIVYLHGGGWVVGALDDYDTLARFMAAESNCVVAMVDYRLAPEYPYPAAVEDAWAALQWVASNRSLIAGESGIGLPLFVAGDSAGGNLAAVVARKAGASGRPELAKQILIYPVTQPNFSTAGYLATENQGLLSREDMIYFWNHYIPDSTKRREPDASPLLAEDLKGLAPATVLIAEHDVLSDEGAAYAEHLKSFGVPVTLRRFHGQIHGFFSILNALPESKTARQFVVDEIRRVIAKTSV